MTQLDIQNLLNQISISKTAGNFLLELSRKALEYYFTNKKPITPNDIKIPSITTEKNTTLKEEISQKRATFVTLEKKQAIRGYSLRGCIGHLIAINPLYIDVLQNTYAAAFEDYRFPPLQEAELKDIRIEISILTPQFPFEYKDTHELLELLNKNKPGVVIHLLGRQATFLPSVWAEISTPKEFLRHLCLKAGLMPNCWASYKPKIFIYFAQKIREKPKKTLLQ